MTCYFICHNGTEVGPLTIDQLKSKSINNETLVWCAGLSDWTKAGQLHELRILFKTTNTSAPAMRKKNFTNRVLNFFK